MNIWRPNLYPKKIGNFLFESEKRTNFLHVGDRIVDMVDSALLNRCLRPENCVGLSWKF